MSTQKDDRRRRVKDAVTSSRLEGQEPTPEFIKDAQAYVNGKISDTELVARGRRRWGLGD